MPFFVNSNGAFYGANGSFVVDKDGNVTAYLYVDGITGMQYRKGAGYANADTDAGRLVVKLPANVENHKVKVTTESGEAELLLNLDLKSAVKQEIKKSILLFHDNSFCRNIGTMFP